MFGEKRKHVRVVFLLLMCVAALGLWSTDCQAASKAQKAKRAYAAYLEKNGRANIPDKNYYDAAYQSPKKNAVSNFVIYDLDKNGVPELITFTPINFRWYIRRILTYKNGKVVMVKFSNGKDAVFDNCSVANGYYTNYICKKRHFHNRYVGSYETFDEAYKMKNGKLVFVTSTKKAHTDNTKIYPKTNTAANRRKLKK